MISVHVNITLHFLLTVLGAIESSVSFINGKEQMKVSKCQKCWNLVSKTVALVMLLKTED